MSSTTTTVTSLPTALSTSAAEKNYTLASIAYLDRVPIYFPSDENPVPEKPYMIRFPVDQIPGAKQTNLTFTPYHDIPVLDLRKHEVSMNLDSAGFELVDFTTKFPREEFGSVERFDGIKQRFFNELEDFVVKKLGATWAEVYACDIRRRAPDYPQVQFSKESQPLRAVHCDHSVDDAKNIVSASVQSRGEKRPGRAQLITVWKPLQPIVRDWPLGLCDYRSVDLEQDVIDVDLVFPDVAREGSNLFHNKDHKWYFLSDQRESEAWLIKTYDSFAWEGRGVAPFSPHAAFEWKDCPAPKEMRESIETRVVVYTV